jgi:hypothetical protein
MSTYYYLVNSRISIKAPLIHSSVQSKPQIHGELNGANVPVMIFMWRSHYLTLQITKPLCKKKGKETGSNLIRTCLAPLAVKVGLPQADALAGDVGHLLPGTLLVRPLLHLHTNRIRILETGRVNRKFRHRINIIRCRFLTQAMTTRYS